MGEATKLGYVNLDFEPAPEFMLCDPCHELVKKLHEDGVEA